MQINGPDGNEQERRRLKQRVVAYETLLKEARYVLENNRLAGDLWAGALSDRITAALNAAVDVNYEAMTDFNATR